MKHILLLQYSIFQPVWIVVSFINTYYQILKVYVHHNTDAIVTENMAGLWTHIVHVYMRTGEDIKSGNCIMATLLLYPRC